MGELNDFYKKIQMYLMKKNQELGELKLLTANITTENSHHVEDICKSMINTFESYNIPIAKNVAINNEKGIQAYKYLLLNTNFENQGRLAEDLANGHLVDMCPPLSPFLFMQILWSLKYEKILIESLVYLPFDLCTEILQHITKQINTLPYQRINEIIYQLIFNIYIKFYQLKEFGIQSSKVENSIQTMLLGSQEFLLLLKDSKLCCLTDVSNLTKYERSGILLKKLIGVTKRCFQIKDDGIPISKDLERLYNVTFGREPFVKCEDVQTQTALSELNQHVIELLVTKVKEVDGHMYLAWAEMIDENNGRISLQRSIGIECYYFIDFISKDPVLLEVAQQLAEYLQFLSSKPDPTQSNFVLGIQELCEALGNGQKELMPELLTRYKEWDRTTIDFFENNRFLLDKQGCLVLLEYLTFLLRQTTIDSEDRDYCYHMVMKLLSYQSLAELYEIVMSYLMKHNGNNYLGTSETCDTFVRYIKYNTNLRSSGVLKIVLLFILKDLKGIITILLKIIIGRFEYSQIMIDPSDILLLSSFLRMRDNNNEILLTSILRTLCIQNTEWIATKFTGLIKVLIENATLKLQELVNDVFVEYLMEDSLNVSNLHTVLTVLRMFHVRHSEHMNTKDLVIALARRMNSIRNNYSISKFTSNQLLLLISRIVYMINGDEIPLSLKERMLHGLELVMKPADKPHFLPFFPVETDSDKGAMIIVEAYERHCLSLLNRLKEDPKTPVKVRESLNELNLLREDFLHHLIIHVTEVEFSMYFMDLALVCHSHFNWDDTLDAYCNIMRLTTEACCLYLEFPFIGARDTFPFLLKSLIQYTKVFTTLNGFSSFDVLYDNFIANMNLLNNTVKYSPYDCFFDDCLLQSKENRTPEQTIRFLKHKLTTLDHFSDQCYKSSIVLKVEPGRPKPRKIINFYVAHEVISACLRVPATDSNQCVKKLNEIFSVK